MTSTAEKLYEGAMALPDEAREALALAILDSIPSSPRKEVAEAWRVEVVRRLGEVHRGDIVTESWAEVEAHLDRAWTR